MIGIKNKLHPIDHVCHISRSLIDICVQLKGGKAMFY